MNLKLDNIISELKQFLEDHKCSDIRIFNVKETSSLADYVAIATVSSSGHLRGVVKHLYDFLEEKGLSVLARQKKIQSDNWIFIDCSSVLIHIMNNEARQFYQLEDLWFDAKEV